LAVQTPHHEPDFGSEPACRLNTVHGRQRKNRGGGPGRQGARARAIRRRGPGASRQPFRHPGCRRPHRRGRAGPAGLVVLCVPEALGELRIDGLRRHRRPEARERCPHLRHGKMRRHRSGQARAHSCRHERPASPQGRQVPCPREAALRLGASGRRLQLGADVRGAVSAEGDPGTDAPLRGRGRRGRGLGGDARDPDPGGQAHGHGRVRPCREEVHPVRPARRLLQLHAEFADGRGVPLGLPRRRVPGLRRMHVLRHAALQRLVSLRVEGHAAPLHGIVPGVQQGIFGSQEGVPALLALREGVLLLARVPEEGLARPQRRLPAEGCLV
ncbi:hypothetical protein DFJ74DRAFT_737838, partial [Hyaloraphidium curvatum]